MCSMHPQVRLPKPGQCPICSMPLILATPAVKAATTNATTNALAGAAPELILDLSDHARAMASVETTPVQRRKMNREIRVVGKVQYNETGLANITTRVEGYVERLFVDYTGIEVKPGDHLVEIYSPDLLVAQQELLIAMDSQRNASLVESARRKLLLWGLTQEQVEELERDKKVSDRITLFSPIHGTVTEKLVVQKAMVKPGEMLYRLANLESVWVYLDIYESELPWVQYGQMVETKSEAIPGEGFSGRVWFISPVLNEETRTVKVLLNINNTERKLKPGMYVSAVIRVGLRSDGKPAPTGVEGKWSCPMHPLVLQPQAGQCPVCKMTLVQIPGTSASLKPEGDQLLLAVPVTAVLDSGVRKLVYVEKGKGQFAAVEVVTGPRTDDSYPVLSGLSEGDKVVTRGNFLLDSQFQIRGLPSLFYKEGQAAAAGHQHGGASPPTEGASRSPTPPSSAPKAQGHDQHKP
ncbi:MAG TPA: efflux RND transporter periplasmic adaptor subunit [Verrucomicrobiota bacterium]|nr:secretion protein HlyD [Verrucomicrobiales bacterium]HRI14254.1 efflux RND transporter periplasmic adaptor subunit [Verrucomicrobiota bacterium]